MKNLTFNELSFQKTFNKQPEISLNHIQLIGSGLYMRILIVERTEKLMNLLHIHLSKRIKCMKSLEEQKEFYVYIVGRLQISYLLAGIAAIWLLATVSPFVPLHVILLDKAHVTLVTAERLFPCKRHQ